MLSKAKIEYFDDDFDFVSKFKKTSKVKNLTAGLHFKGGRSRGRITSKYRGHRHATRNQRNMDKKRIVLPEIYNTIIGTLPSIEITANVSFLCDDLMILILLASLKKLQK
jgi:hypothetical protein